LNTIAYIYTWYTETSRMSFQEELVYLYKNTFAKVARNILTTRILSRINGWAWYYTSAQGFVICHASALTDGTRILQFRFVLFKLPRLYPSSRPLSHSTNFLVSSGSQSLKYLSNNNNLRCKERRTKKDIKKNKTKMKVKKRRIS
jgi:hypothetical protein